MQQQLSNKVAIFGASSQVGSSVALYFKKYTNIIPVCFIRSTYSSVFFDMFNIQSVVADLNNEETLRQHLSNIDWVLDFTYPTGQVAEIPKIIDANLSKVISCMPTNANFIYMSSIMAYGMPDGDKYLKEHFISHTTYSYIKRLAEKLTLKYCRKHNVTPYIFRLSQVHGFLQSVNNSYRKKLTQSANLVLDVKKDDVSNTIFISSLASAIEKCISKEVASGVYTLVSNPQWTFEQLYNYYNITFKLNCNINFVPLNQLPFLYKIKQILITKIKKLRPLIEAYFLMNNASLAAKLKGQYRIAETKSQINKLNKDYFDFHLIGKPSTKIIENINSDFEQILKIESELEDFYLNAISANSINTPPKNISLK